MNKINVAVVQAGACAFDVEMTLAKVLNLTKCAAQQDAKLVLFPEAMVSAYPKGLDFGVCIGNRKPEGREDFRRYWQSAIEVPGQACQKLSEIAAECQVYLVIGVVEREGGTLYCTVLFFAPDGELLGKHRKLMPTASERLVWGQGDGSTLTTVSTPWGEVGAVICWENYMPMLRMFMYSKGIALYCAPTADDRESWLATMRHIAMEGRCFVLSACQFMTRKDYPQDYALNAVYANSDILMRGGSCIIGPLGEVLAGPILDKEEILVETIDLDDIPRARLDFDAVGHYARSDIFQLNVREKAYQPVRVLTQQLDDDQVDE